MDEVSHRMGKVEQAILEILETSKAGEIYQSDLVRQIGFSRSRVSEVLSCLESRGLISRAPLGKNFRILYTGNFRKLGKNSSKILKLGMIRASEYPFVLPFEKSLREKIGITLRFVFYDNGLDLSRDLSRMRLDFGIAPVLTHFVFFSIGSPIKMIAPAGAGGAAILVNRSRRDSSKDFRVGTTKLSTMELMLRSSIKDGDVPSSSSVSYYQSPKRMASDLLSGEVDAACLWEPYSTMLSRKPGFRKLLRYEDSSKEHLCCALAAGNHIESGTLYQLAKTFTEALESYRKNPESYVARYSAMLRYDAKLMQIAAKEYTYPSELDPHKLARQFERAGIKIPLPSTVKDAVLPAR
ncbi:MAG TPA: ABC transporter substrate-binding protein [Nitrososphaerales archaeon]|nr:ABC transporter substrate-binding protein [Nitrososphaerales archaeon]